MKNLSWAAYGLGVVVIVFVLTSGELGVVPKTLIVAATLFVGALIAALGEVARSFSGTTDRMAPGDSQESASATSVRSRS